MNYVFSNNSKLYLFSSRISWQSFEIQTKCIKNTLATDIYKKKTCMLFNSFAEIKLNLKLALVK